MSHPADGVLRRLLDEPAGIADPDRQHVADCPRCLTELAAVREDAVLVDAALSPVALPPGALPAGASAAGISSAGALSSRTDADADVDAAWARLSAAPAAERGRGASPTRAGRSRAVLRRPAAAALAAAVVLGGAGAAAAGGWLRVFQTEQVAAVSIGPDDLVALPDLDAYGDLEVTGDPAVHEVPDASAAAAATGLDVPDVTALPRGVSGEPVYQVGDEASATFTFSEDRAARAADGSEEELPPTPPGLDGSQVHLVAGPGVAQVWSSGTGAPALLVGRAVAPSAYSDGVPFEVVRDHLLSLPGLPDDVAAQLRAFTADGTTLPLPVPGDEVTTSDVAVDGAPATLVQTRDQTMAAVVWVTDGVVTVVAGSLDDDEVLAVAEDLR